MHPVVRKLSIFAAFSQEEASAIGLALRSTIAVPAREVIAREDEPAVNVFFLLEGFVSRHKLLPSGRKQILSFMIPGDFCDVGISILERRDHSLTAMTASVLARVSDTALEHLMQQYPKIRAALRWAALAEESVLREWILNIGQRQASARMAHLICEVYHRLHAIGLAEALNFELPLTQTDLADALGISAVHVNRTLQELRRDKLIAFGDGRMTILELDKLMELAEFDDTYLHLGARYQDRQKA